MGTEIKNLVQIDYFDMKEEKASGFGGRLSVVGQSPEHPTKLKSITIKCED